MSLIPKHADAHPHPSRPTLGELLGIARTEGDPTTEDHNPAEAFPLQRVKATACIVGDCATTELTQHYLNRSDTVMDVTHLIPIPASAAVVGFEIRAGDRLVRGVCKPTVAAQADFEDARERGKTAAMVTQVRADQHSVTLANVPPRTDVTVVLRIVDRLRVDDGRFEYRLPTTIAQKFVPGAHAIGHDGPGVSPDTEAAPDASHLSPPVLLEGDIPLQLEVRIASGVTEILPTIALERTDDPDGTVVLRPSGRQSCSGDVVIRYWGRGERTHLRAYTDGVRTMVVVDPPATRAPELERVREAVFVLDRSGSMRGTPIEAAKQALEVAIRQLKPTDRLTVMAFNWTPDLFDEPEQPATPDHVDKALAWLRDLRIGGATEALPALEMACGRHIPAGHVRTVLFLTDGHVANDEQIVRFTNSLDPAVRISVVGVGCAPQRLMLERLARLGGGSFAHIEEEDDIAREATAIAATMLGPIACGLHEVGSELPDASGVRSTRPDLFAGRSCTMFIDGPRSEVRVASADGAFEGTCTVLPSPMPLGPLWARDAIERLEDERIARPQDHADIDARITELGVDFQLQTRGTSFVAVDEASQVHGEAVHVMQPVGRTRDQDAVRQNRLAAPMQGGHDGGTCYEIASPDHGRPGLFGGTAWRQRSARDSLIGSGRNARPSRKKLHLFMLGFGDHSSFDFGQPMKGNRTDGWWEAAGGVAKADALLLMKLFEQKFRILANGVPEGFTPVDIARVLVLLVAFGARLAKRDPLPDNLRGHDLSRTGPLWNTCMARLAPLASTRGWKGFTSAANRGAFAEVVRRVEGLRVE